MIVTDVQFQFDEHYLEYRAAFADWSTDSDDYVWEGIAPVSDSKFVQVKKLSGGVQGHDPIKIDDCPQWVRDLYAKAKREARA